MQKIDFLRLYNPWCKKGVSFVEQLVRVRWDVKLLMLLPSLFLTNIARTCRCGQWPTLEESTWSMRSNRTIIGEWLDSWHMCFYHQDTKDHDDHEECMYFCMVCTTRDQMVGGSRVVRHFTFVSYFLQLQGYY